MGFNRKKWTNWLKKQSIILFVLLFGISLISPLILPHISLSKTIAQTSSNTTQLVEKAQQAYQIEQFEEAASLWQQSADHFARQGDQLNQAMALSNLSLTYQQLGQWEAAQTAIAQSLSLLQPLDKNPSQQRILAASLEIEGQLQLSLGKGTEALETWQKATDIYKEQGNQQKVSQSQINQAQAMQALGFYPRACLTLLDALGLESSECQISQEELANLPNNLPVSLQILGLRSLGNVLRATGQIQLSREVLLKSWDLAQNSGNKEDLSEIYLSLGNTLQVIGDQTQRLNPNSLPINLQSSVSCLASEDYPISSKFYEQAIACYRQAASQNKPITQIQAQLNLLSLLIQLQQWSAVTPLISQIQAQLSPSSPPNLQSLPPSQAITAQLKLAQNLMCLRSQVSDHKNQAVTPILQACPKDSKIQLEKLSIEQIPTWEAIYQQVSTANQQAQRLGDPKAMANTLGYLGAIYQGIGQDQEGRELTKQALQQISAFNYPELAYFWQWQLGRFYQLQGETDQAIAAYSLAIKILESLRGDLVTSNADVQFNFRDSVEPIYRELVDLLLVKEQNGSISQENLKKARDVIDSLQIAELDNFFQEACLETESQNVEQLDPNAAVIYSIVLRGRLAIILSLPKKPLSYHEIQLSQPDEIETAFDDFLTNLHPSIRSPNPLKARQQFYDWLIRPLEAELANNQVKTLVFVLDGLLRNVPMAALHDGEKYLVEKYNLALTPSLQLLSPRSLTPNTLNTLAAGLAEARQGFSPLPGVKEEVQEISQIVNTEILLDKDFTRERFQQEVAAKSFPVVHLATHGQFSSQVEQTFLLTWDERINVKNLDALLRERGKQRRDPIELLILSACQTAAGDRRAVLGLAGTAVRSGARSTLATLWAIQDQSTADLIAEFYNILQQEDMTKAEALRQAQLSLLRSSEYQHPFYWSPFVLVGNWL